MSTDYSLDLSVSTLTCQDVSAWVFSLFVVYRFAKASDELSF